MRLTPGQIVGIAVLLCTVVCGGGLTLFGLILVVVENEPAQHESRGRSPQSRRTLVQTPTEAAAPTTRDIAIAILEEEVHPPHKRVLMIQLDRKLTEPQLRIVAQQLRDGDSVSYNNTFISYRLPGTEAPSVWATSHFTPELSIVFNGMTIEEEASARASTTPDGEVVGQWMNASVLGGKLTIVRTADGVELVTQFSPESSHAEKLVERPSRDGPRFYRKSNPDEYYRVDGQGGLQVWDPDGLFMTSKPVR